MLSRRRIGVIAAVVAAGLIAAGVIVVNDEQTPPPTPQQPAPRGLDDEGDLRLIRQTPTRIVLGWTPELTGYGYLFSGDGTVVARTTDPARDQATFRNIYTSYEVAAIDKGDTGTYSPLAGTLTMTVTAETANTITFGWTPQAEYGYLFSGDGEVISRTYDPNRSYAKFNKTYTDYEVAVLVKGVVGTWPPPAPPAGTANVWIDTNGGTCTRSASPVSYSDAAACATLIAGYAAASTGDEIGLKGGTYSTSHAQNTLSGSKTITMRVPEGETAVFTNWVYLGVGVDGAGPLSNFTLYGPIDTSQAHVPNTDLFPDFAVTGCSQNITVYDVSGVQFGIGGAGSDARGEVDNVSVYDSDFGGYTGDESPLTNHDEEDSWIGGDTIDCGRDGITSNILLDNIYIHDVVYEDFSDGDAHPDCLQTGGLLDGLTIRDSVFSRCGNSFLGFYGDFGDFTDIVLENNLFYGIYDSFWGFNIDPKTNECSITVRHNTYWPDNDTDFGGYTYSPPSILCQTLTVVGNIWQAGEPGGCGAFGDDWDYNYFAIDDESHDPCGTNTTVGTPGFIDAVGPWPTASVADYNFHLGAGADALGKGKPGSAPTDFPTTDFEGTARSSPPDAGYDER